MNGQEVAAVAEQYKTTLVEACRYFLGREDAASHRDMTAADLFGQICHLLWMCDQIPDFIRNGRVEKAHRWLGFTQGSMWALGIRDIEAMKSDNMPEGYVFDKDRV